MKKILYAAVILVASMCAACALYNYYLENKRQKEVLSELHMQFKTSAYKIREKQEGKPANYIVDHNEWKNKKYAEKVTAVYGCLSIEAYDYGGDFPIYIISSYDRRVLAKFTNSESKVEIVE